MFGNTEKAALEERIAALEKENAALKQQIDNMELTFYRKMFERVQINIEGVFKNDKETL